MLNRISPIPPPLLETVIEETKLVTRPWSAFFNYLFGFVKIRWRDINIGTASLTKAASNQPSLVTIAGTDVQSYGFSGGTGVEELHGAFELQHDYQEGTDILPHVHWYPEDTGQGTVIFNLDYVIVKHSGNHTGTSSSTTDAPGTAWDWTFAEFTAISGDILNIGDQIHFRLWRDGDADTYAGSAVLGTLGIHYRIDFPGSMQKTSK